MGNSLKFNEADYDERTFGHSASRFPSTVTETKQPTVAISPIKTQQQRKTTTKLNPSLPEADVHKLLYPSPKRAQSASPGKRFSPNSTVFHQQQLQTLERQCMEVESMRVDPQTRLDSIMGRTQGSPTNRPASARYEFS